MIENVQIAPKVYRTQGNPTALGYYQNPITGEWLWYDATTGLFYPLAWDFWVPDANVQIAPSSKVLRVWPNDTIRIYYSFKYTGPAETLTIEAGNCGFVWRDPITDMQQYDKGSRNTVSKSVSASTGQTYTGYVDVELESTSFPPFVEIFIWKHIYFLITGKDQEFVMKNALEPYTGAIFEELEITNWQKV